MISYPLIFANLFRIREDWRNRLGVCVSPTEIKLQSPIRLRRRLIAHLTHPCSKAVYLKATMCDRRVIAEYTAGSQTLREHKSA